MTPMARSMCGISLAMLFPLAALADEPAKPAESNGEVVKLFDGKTLEGWKASNFAGAGEVTVENGQLIINKGE